jgi:hypothetical protein
MIKPIDSTHSIFSVVKFYFVLVHTCINIAAEVFDATTTTRLLILYDDANNETTTRPFIPGEPIFY